MAESTGEINGTAVMVQNSSGVIVGQGDFTHTYGGSLIETTNKSGEDTITYLEGAGSGKQHVFAGDFVYNDDAQFRAMIADTLAHASDTYTLTYISAVATVDEVFTGKFFPNAMANTIPMGGAIRTAMTFSSSGVVTHTPAS